VGPPVSQGVREKEERSGEAEGGTDSGSRRPPTVFPNTFPMFFFISPNSTR
jgi:hypothetical protein